MNTPTIKKAHQPHILAIDSAFLKTLGFKQGMNEFNLEEFSTLVNGQLTLGRRYELESDPSKRQILPYLIIQQELPKQLHQDGVTMVRLSPGIWGYNRSVAGGEAALHNKVSIGVGGHVDLPYVIHDAGIINLLATVLTGILREGDEEVQILDPDGKRWTMAELVENGKMPIQGLGFMVDDRDEVGTKHLAVVMTMLLPEGWTVVSNEDDIENMKLYSVLELLKGDGKDFTLEGWSEIIVAEFFDNAMLGAMTGEPTKEEELIHSAYSQSRLFGMMDQAREVDTLATPPDQTVEAEDPMFASIYDDGLDDQDFAKVLDVLPENVMARLNWYGRPGNLPEGQEPQNLMRILFRTPVGEEQKAIDTLIRVFDEAGVPTDVPPRALPLRDDPVTRNLANVEIERLEKAGFVVEGKPVIEPSGSSLEQQFNKVFLDSSKTKH